MRFFAIFHTATGVLTFLVQISASRLSLEMFGLGKTAAAHSSMLALGGVAALAVPGLAGVGAAREVPDRQSSTLEEKTADPRSERVGFLSILESGDPDQIKQTLSREPLQSDSIPHVIPLLAWDEVTGQATRALVDSSADIRPT